MKVFVYGILTSLGAILLSVIAAKVFEKWQRKIHWAGYLFFAVIAVGVGGFAPKFALQPDEDPFAKATPASQSQKDTSPTPKQEIRATPATSSPVTPLPQTASPTPKATPRPPIYTGPPRLIPSQPRSYSASLRRGAIASIFLVNKSNQAQVPFDSGIASTRDNGTRFFLDSFDRKGKAGITTKSIGIRWDGYLEIDTEGDVNFMITIHGGSGSAGLQVEDENLASMTLNQTTQESLSKVYHCQSGLYKCQFWCANSFFDSNLAVHGIELAIRKPNESGPRQICPGNLLSP